MIPYIGKDVDFRTTELIRTDPPGTNSNGGEVNWLDPVTENRALASQNVPSEGIIVYKQ